MEKEKEHIDAVKKGMLQQLMSKAVDDYSKRVFYYDLMEKAKDIEEKKLWESMWNEYVYRDGAYFDLATKLFGMTKSEYYDVLLNGLSNKV